MDPVRNILGIQRDRRSKNIYGIKCKASKVKGGSELCGEPATHNIVTHSNIYANLEEIDGQKLPICDKHKKFFEQKEFRGTYKTIRKI